MTITLEFREIKHKKEDVLGEIKKSTRLDIVFQIRGVSREACSVCVCLQMRFQTVLCFTYTGDMIFVTVSKIKQILFSPRVPPPMKNHGCAPGTRIHGVTSQKTSVYIFVKL